MKRMKRTDLQIYFRRRFKNIRKVQKINEDASSIEKKTMEQVEKADTG